MDRGGVEGRGEEGREGRKGGEGKEGRVGRGSHADVPQAKQRCAYVTCHIFLYSGVA